MNDKTILYAEESYKVMGACFEVYKEKGCGFLEPVYQESLEWELGLQGIPFRAQVELQLSYKGHPLKHRYVPDLICFEKIIVELKAVTQLADEHRAQVHNYLRASGYHLGLLVTLWSSPQSRVRTNCGLTRKTACEPRNTRNTRKSEKRMNIKAIFYAEESYKVMGACFEVYKEKGCGFVS